MKHFHLSFLLALLMSMAGAKVLAYDAYINGIYYNFSGNEATAVTNYSNKYTGVVVIPTSVIFNGNTYDVTGIGEYAFRSCSGLTSVIIPKSVTTIGSFAFQNCSQLTYIEIPGDITSWGDDVFSGCESLATVVISGEVDTIGKDAFSYCYKLSSVQITGGVKAIGAFAFWECRGLTSFEFPNMLETIGRSAFYGTGIISLHIPASVTHLWNVSGEESFRTMPNLETITVDSKNPKYDSRNSCNAIIETNTNTLIVGAINTIIPESVTAIGSHAFEGRTKITSITIPSSVESINNGAFYQCLNLTSIAIPETVTSIGRFAFADCNKLRSVPIPESVYSIGSYAFHNTPFYNSLGLNYAGKVCYKYNGTMNENTVITLREDTKGIAAEAFKDCENLKAITIPSNVICIGESAFDGCNNLTSVTVMRQEPVKISSGAFTNASNATLCVPAGCKAAYEAAEYWKDFKEIVEKPQVIAFADVNVKTVCVANWDTNGDGELDVDEAAAVTSLGSAFKGNTMILSFDELSHFTGVKYISRQEFSGCSSLTSIAIPKTVTSVGDEAFDGCKALAAVHIQDLTAWCQIQFTLYQSNPLSFAHHLFLDGEAVSQLFIPEGISQINIAAFQNCEDLVSVTLPGSVTSIGMNAFSGCKHLSSFDFCETVTTIGDGAFANCLTLHEVILPNSIKILRPNAFAGCTSLETLTIGENVTEIWQAAFSGCTSLSSVYCLSPTVPTTNGLAFQSVPVQKVILYVPTGSKQAYETAEVWRAFKEIVEIGTEAGEDEHEATIVFAEATEMTYCPAHDLDFSAVESLKAYTITAYDMQAEQLTAVRADNVPAGTGLLLRADAAGTYKVPYTDSRTYCVNLLVGATEAVTINAADGDMANFTYSNGFFHRVEDAQAVGANEAYLQVPTNVVAGVKSLAVSFDAETVVGIGEVKEEKEATQGHVAGLVYDFNGSRLAAMRSGLNLIRMSDGSVRKVMKK